MYFALPIILGNLFQQLYSLTDAVIVGRFVNLNALAAIGGTGWVRWAILGVCMDCTMGFGIVASRRIGAGDRTGFKEVVAAGIEFVLAAGLSLTLLSCLSLDFVLHLLHIPENIYEDARLYLWYASVSIPVGLIYNMACAFLRAAGNSKGPFAAVVLSAILNVALDLYFIVDLHWGVCGAAGPDSDFADGCGCSGAVSDGKARTVSYYEKQLEVEPAHTQGDFCTLDSHAF